MIIYWDLISKFWPGSMKWNTPFVNIWIKPLFIFQQKVAKLSSGEQSDQKKDIKISSKNNKDNGDAKVENEPVIKLQKTASELPLAATKQPVAASELPLAATKQPVAAAVSLTAIQGLMAAYSDSESDNEEES